MSLAALLKHEAMNLCISGVAVFPRLALLSAGIDDRPIIRTPTIHFDFNELLAKYLAGRYVQ